MKLPLPQEEKKPKMKLELEIYHHDANEAIVQLFRVIEKIRGGTESYKSGKTRFKRFYVNENVLNDTICRTSNETPLESQKDTLKQRFEVIDGVTHRIVPSKMNFE
jgi:hypothetical protein